jgi:hypothetical protein
MSSSYTLRYHERYIPAQRPSGLILQGKAISTHSRRSAAFSTIHNIPDMVRSEEQA